jgi:PBSX family phage terminase large subunit
MARLIEPQARFLELPKKYPLYVGGYGSGKTWAGSAKLCRNAWELPKIRAGYFAPTIPLIRDIFYPTIDEVAHDWGLRAVVRETNKEVHLYNGRTYRTTIICRSMEKPASIIGFSIGHALVDEIDTLPLKKAEDAWRKVIARIRQPGGTGQVAATTTPEGFHFTWKTWVKGPREDQAVADRYGMVRSSTYDNEANLQPGYIDDLLSTYPESLVQAYLLGKFVNLAQGTVYREYNREKNRSNERIQPGETLRVGMDFNVGKMAAVVHVIRDGWPHAVDEIIGALDTPDMIRQIKERYWRFSGSTWEQTRQIRVYPDSSGQNRTTTGAASTDIQLLKTAGFWVSAPPANPPVRDRVNAMNGVFRNAQGERHYRVNPDTCPTFVECLEQQAYDDNGQPDKTSGLDHANDAAGYFIHREHPLQRPVTSLKIGVAQ